MSEIAAGSHAAFSSLYDQYAPAVYGIATRAARSQDEADAITMATFTWVWRNATRLKHRVDMRLIAASVAARIVRPPTSRT